MRQITDQEQQQGFVVCNCGKFAHVFRAGVLQQLPKDYLGELCPECKLFVVAIEKLTGGK